ncbi:trithorax group protein osa-like isoform X2 [Phymastichus coffea]|nr:trithorax group protein osa-like isoform X2 [Phymastichus coffea]XP_058796615.1 trithorax group protein osa-like isoform X2 [Phymastichus coffea]XP_058796616.1 trithorax group protein osa-like isoform X2 [Phymastichus coffea]
MNLTMNPNLAVNSGYPNMMMNNGYASTYMSVSNGYTNTSIGMNNMYPNTNLNNAYASVNTNNAYPSINTSNAYPSVNTNNAYPSVNTNNVYPNANMNNAYPITNTNNAYPSSNTNMSNGYANMNMSMSNGYTSPPSWVKREPVYQEKIEKMEKVETVTPIMYKRKKLTRAEIGSVEAWRIMMALRSSLLAERCWALDVLNSLLFDDTSVQYFGLTHLPGLLDVLLEHFALSLADMFDSSLVEEELCCFYQNVDESDNDSEAIIGPVNPKDRTKILSCSNYTFLTRNRKPVKIVTSSRSSPIVNWQNNRKVVTKDQSARSRSCTSSNSSSCGKVSLLKNGIEAQVNDSIVLEKDQMRIKVRDPAGILKRRMSDYEDESYTRDEGSLHLLSDSQDNLAQQCVCLSTILRNLTFIPGNELEFARNSMFLSLLGKLLLLHHEHPTHKKRDYDRDEDADFLDTNCGNLHNEDEWWWGFLYHIRENVLVMAANISGYTDLSQYAEKISRPVIDGLLHWAVCPAAHGQDPLPTVSSNLSLSPQRLALEALCKLCVTKNNVDLVVATPPYSRFQRLCSVLSRFLHRNEEQVLREFAITLLDFLSSADSGLARTVALQTPCVNLLVSFVEQAESIGLGIANRYGIAALRDNPETMGTSLDMLRRAADTLLQLSRHPDNRTLLLQHETRLLSLSMSQILDQQVTAIVTQVLFQCSRGNS